MAVSGKCCTAADMLCMLCSLQYVPPLGKLKCGPAAGKCALA